MPYVHEHPAFDTLLLAMAEKHSLAVGLIEKDYWVTHTLWALQQSGLEIWFKGGTSLSKGYGLLQRFSEDLDLKVAAGKDAPLPEAGNWKSDGPTAVAARKAFFKAMADSIKVPDAEIEFAEDQDEHWRSVSLRVKYTIKYPESAEVLRPFVLLEIGDARVTPFEKRSPSSFVHDELDVLSQSGDFHRNRPKDLPCLHPQVTLIEKLDAVSKRFPKDQIAASAFVRHYEDAVKIIRAANLPVIGEYDTVRALADDLAAKRQIAALPRADDPAFAYSTAVRWQELEAAWQTIGPMFWGSRISLEECCQEIRTWISGQIA